jgi:carbon storage regulator CsrA
VSAERGPGDAGVVLTRRKGEVVMIGDEVSVCVEEIQGNRVVLRFAAPPGVAVDRLEVWKAIKNQGGRRRGNRRPHNHGRAGG